MIRAIAAAWIPVIPAAILRIGRGQAAPPIRRWQMIFDCRYHAPRFLPGQQRMKKAYGENLVRPDGGVAAPLAHDVVETFRLLVPEQAGKARLRPVRQLPVACGACRPDYSRGGFQ